VTKYKYFAYVGLISRRSLRVLCGNKNHESNLGVERILITSLVIYELDITQDIIPNIQNLYSDTNPSLAQRQDNYLGKKELKNHSRPKYNLTYCEHSTILYVVTYYCFNILVITIAC